MRNRPTLITWSCPSCGEDTDINVWPFVPAKVSGPPEHCYPAEGGEIDPGNCSNCDAPIDVGAAMELASDADAAAQEAHADEKIDEWKERNL